MRTYGKHLPLKSTVVFGGVGIQSADRHAAPRRGYPGGDTGPSARPRQPEDRGPVPRRNPGAGRSRPHARHGLHSRHPQDPRAAAQEAPEPAVLGHLLRRDQAARRRPAECARADRSGAPQYRRRTRVAGGASGGSRAQARTAVAPDSFARLEAGAGVHPHQARRQPSGRTAGGGRHQRCRHPRQQEPGCAHQGAWRISRRAKCGCWWRPTSPRADSTSTSCRTW